MTSAAATARAAGVTAGERLSNAVFGSPRAGLAHGSYAIRCGSSRRIRARREATPVFALGAADAAGGLPRVWITAAAPEGRGGGRCGREFVASYPNGADRGGARALEYAEGYLGEARTAAGAAAAHLRTECFRAAEVLLLHAASRGNVEACVRLAELYGEDSCDGFYWEGAAAFRARHRERMDGAERERRVREWLLAAARRGSAEACLELGGRLLASEAARHEGYLLCLRAYKLAVPAAGDCGGEHLVVAGEAALRLAQCHELAHGCCMSLEAARTWYGIAADLLALALEDGNWCCKRSHATARTGHARMTQELAGCY